MARNYSGKTSDAAVKRDLFCLVIAAIFVAIEISSTRFIFANWAYLPPGTYMVRVSAQFLCYALCGWFVGPVWAMASAVAGDLIGVFINAGGGGSIFLGYTATAAISGLMFGFLLHKREPKLWRAILVLVIYQLVICLPLNSLWREITGFMGFWECFKGSVLWRGLLVLPEALILVAVQYALRIPLKRGFR